MPKLAFKRLNLDCHTNKIKAFYWILGISAAASQAIRYCYNLSSNDVVAYLDVADAYLSDDWSNAINGNWSPLYSWILAAFMWALSPTIAYEFPLIKLVNFIIFLFIFCCFEFFLSQLIRYTHQKNLPNSSNESLCRYIFKIPKWIWLCVGYPLFLLSSLYWIGINCDTPDMINAGLIYLAAGLILRIYRHPESVLSFLALGIALAFGYFSRAAMFPLGFLFLGCSLLIVGKPRKTLPRALSALAIFLLIVSPYVTALSLKKGHLTFSETGKLSYIWYVYPTLRVVPDTLWDGEYPEFGAPKNPLRKIFQDPEVFEFGEPIDGTYPLWTDPSYWYDGVIAKFRPRRIAKIFIQNTQFYWRMFLGVLVLVYAVLGLWIGRVKPVLIKPNFASLIGNWHLLIPSIAGLTLYAISTNFTVNNLVHQPSSRFIAPFVVILFAGLYSSIKLPNSLIARSLISSLAILVVGVSGFYFSSKIIQNMTSIAFDWQSNMNFQIAKDMASLGLNPGDKIAFFGNENHRSNHVYWARLARVKIAAQLKDPENFWNKDEATKTSVLDALKAANIDVAVQAGLPSQIMSAQNSGWKKVGELDYYAYFLGPR